MKKYASALRLVPGLGICTLGAFVALAVAIFNWPTNLIWVAILLLVVGSIIQAIALWRCRQPKN